MVSLSGVSAFDPERTPPFFFSALPATRSGGPVIYREEVLRVVQIDPSVLTVRTSKALVIRFEICQVPDDLGVEAHRRHHQPAVRGRVH